jgi:hypothetical protein
VQAIEVITRQKQAAADMRRKKLPIMKWPCQAASRPRSPRASCSVC